jgi:lipopolysaccharide/colanic/teichoic acid biosynthesis glycosyltransferase
LVRELARNADAVGLDVMVVPPLAELLRPLPPGLRGPRADDPAETDAAGRGLPAGVLGWGKRAFDVASCLVLIMVILPIVAVIVALLAIAGGPVLYRAPRVGRDGHVFMIYKFATMTPGNGGPRVTRGSDSRITPVGRWLRSTKLNELPQLLNVLKGEMSLVGPRPEDPHFASSYSARQRQVLAARPGLTSPTFLEYGDEQAFLDREHPDDIETYYVVHLMPRKLDIELRYLTGWTMREDLRILAWTALRLVYRRSGVATS